ncbi:17095_t:CDS:2, partial [Cetraspora pellucida]
TGRDPASGIVGARIAPPPGRRAPPSVIAMSGVNSPTGAELPICGIITGNGGGALAIAKENIKLNGPNKLLELINQMLEVLSHIWASPKWKLYMSSGKPSINEGSYVCKVISSFLNIAMSELPTLRILPNSKPTSNEAKLLSPPVLSPTSATSFGFPRSPTNKLHRTIPTIHGQSQEFIDKERRNDDELKYRQKDTKYRETGEISRDGHYRSSRNREREPVERIRRHSKSRERSGRTEERQQVKSRARDHVDRDRRDPRLREKDAEELGWTIISRNGEDYGHAKSKTREVDERGRAKSRTREVDERGRAKSRTHEVDEPKSRTREVDEPKSRTREVDEPKSKTREVDERGRAKSKTREVDERGRAKSKTREVDERGRAKSRTREAEERERAKSRAREAEERGRAKSRTRETDERGRAKSKPRETEERERAKSKNRETDERGRAKSKTRDPDERGRAKSRTRETDERGRAKSRTRETDEHGRAKSRTREQEDRERAEKATRDKEYEILLMEKEKHTLRREKTKHETHHEKDDTPTSEVTIYIEELRQYREMSLTVNTTALDVLTHFRSDDTISDADAWTLFEVITDLGLERPLRDWEFVAKIIGSWELDKDNSLVLKKYAYRSPLTLQGFNNTVPSMVGFLHLEIKKNKWQKRYFQIKDGSIYHSKDTKGTNEMFLCSMVSFDVYTCTHMTTKKYQT